MKRRWLGLFGRWLGLSAAGLIGTQVLGCGDDNGKVVQPANCGTTPNGETEARVRYESASVAADELCREEEQVRTCSAGRFSEWSGTYASETCRVQGSLSCDGKPHGSFETRTRYEAANVPSAAQCNEETQTRECTDGNWSAWSGSYAEGTCEVLGKASCGEQPHGALQTRKRYESSSVPFGSECSEQTQVRVCDDGQWTDWNGTHQEPDCKVLGRLSCDGKPHGATEKRQRYQTVSVPFGQLCSIEEQTRVCDDGVWSVWSGTFEHSDCDVQDAASCGAAPHGTAEDRVRYEATTVPSGSQCRQETQARTCTDGTWSDWGGTFTAISCEVEGAARCNGQPHGAEETRKRFETSTVPFGADCKEETQTRRCDDGAWSEWTGTFAEPLCGVTDPAACDGQPHGTEDTRKRFAQSSVPFGVLCEEETQRRTCSNGTWSEWTGTYVEPRCDAAPGAACEGQPHGSVEPRTRYERATVPFGSLCDEERQTRICSNGTWSQWSGTYTELTCGVGAPADCGADPHGTAQTRDRFRSSSVPFGSVCEKEAQTRSCNNGAWSEWSGAFTSTSCTVQPDNRPYSCTQFNGLTLCQESSVDLTASCLGTRGRGCTTNDALGRCAMSATTPPLVQYVYPTQGLTTETLRELLRTSCTNGTYEDL